MNTNLNVGDDCEPLDMITSVNQQSKSDANIIFSQNHFHPSINGGKCMCQVGSWNFIHTRI